MTTWLLVVIVSISQGQYNVASHTFAEEYLCKSMAQELRKEGIPGMITVCIPQPARS